jgi:uncharacterized protein with PQ loop repeat
MSVHIVGIYTFCGEMTFADFRVCLLVCFAILAELLYKHLIDLHVDTSVYARRHSPLSIWQLVIFIVLFAVCLYSLSPTGENM